MMNCGHTKKSNCLCKVDANNATYCVQHLREDCKHFITHGSNVCETSCFKTTSGIQAKIPRVNTLENL